MLRFLQPILIIAAGLAVGLMIRRRVERRAPHWEPSMVTLRTRLQRIGLSVLNPLAFALAIWSLPLKDAGLFVLPFVGLFSLVAAFGIGLLGSRLFRLVEPKATSFAITTSFTNIGNIGGLVLFGLVGERGFALLPFYKLFEEFWYYGFLYPYARQKSTELGLMSPPPPSKKSPLLRTLLDPFLLSVIVAVGLGLGLNIAGVQRPAWCEIITSILVPLSSFILLVSLGLGLKFSKIRPQLGPALGLVGLKYGLVPLVTLGFVFILGLWYNELIVNTALVLSAMPIAFAGVVAPGLYKLDLDFTNAAWLLSIAGLAVIVPVLSLLI